MKKFTLILSLALSLMALEGFSSDLNLRMFNNSSFCVELDRQMYGNNNNSFMVSNLIPGSHYLVVYKNSHLNNGRHVGTGIIFSGYITIPGNVKVSAMINNKNRYVVISEVLFMNNAPDHGKKGKKEEHGRNDRRDDRYGKNEHNNGNNGYGYNSYNNYMISPADFSSLKMTILKSGFESTKLGVASNALMYNNFTSAQIAEILYLFTFESTKLEFAKLAYAKVVDKERFFLVYNAFTFKSSIDELNRYISCF